MAERIVFMHMIYKIIDFSPPRVTRTPSGCLFLLPKAESDFVDLVLHYIRVKSSTKFQFNMNSIKCYSALSILRNCHEMID